MIHFDHDCDACVSLGDWTNPEGQVFDLYFCGQLEGAYPTVVSRYSSIGPDYRSGYVFADDRCPDLKEAARRAEQAGLHVAPISCDYDSQEVGARNGSWYWKCSEDAVVSSLCCRQNFCLTHEDSHNEQGCNFS